jgi:hypothetical protein
MVVLAAPFSQVSGTPVAVPGEPTQSVTGGSGLTHFERDYDAMNAIYRDYFDSNKLPARTTVGVTALARGGLIEIDMIAKRSEGHNRHFLDAGY